MSAPCKIDWSKLTTEERQALPLHRDAWVHATFSTEPADRPAAEEAIRQAYRAADLAPPASIIWSQSPPAIERERKSIKGGRVRGAAVKAALVDRVVATTVGGVVTSVASVVRQEVDRALSLGPGAARTINLVGDAVDHAATRFGWGWAAWANTVVNRDRLTSFRQSRWLPGEAASMLSSTAFFDSLGLPQAAPMRGLHALALSAGGIVPHKEICWISDRPDVWQRDREGRLHCADGPALRYRDGTTFYAWKGALIPKRLIDERHSIDRQDVDREQDPLLRRCMIDIMTAEKYIATGGATRVAVDRAGVLWRRVWHGWDVWTAVEVINGTPEPDGRHKRYYLQVPAEVHSPLEAVAWTYGMSANRYMALQHRT